MAKFRPIFRQWAGLNTKGLEDGRRGAESVVLQNFRLRQGAIKKRPGMARLDVASSASAATSYDGATQYVTASIDSRVWALGTKFTIRGIVKMTDTTGTKPVFRAGITTPSVEVTTASGNLVVSVWDSAAVKVSVTSAALSSGTPFTFFFTRDGAALSLRIDNGTAVTGSMDATKSLRTPSGALEFARDGTNYLAGTLDSVDVFNSVLPTNNDRLFRWPDPMRDSSCVASYDFGRTGDGIVKDLSRFRNHGWAQGTPSIVSALAHNHAPVWGIQAYRSRDVQRALVHAGSSAYIVDVV